MKRKRELEAVDYLRTLYPEEGKYKEFGRNVTFQLGEQCTLRCTYCYQGCKSDKAMTAETGKAIVDYLFKLYDEDKEDAFINKHTKMIVLDFIGGEPLMYIDVME